MESGANPVDVPEALMEIPDAPELARMLPAVFRLIAKGEPVPLEQVAQAIGCQPEEASALLAKVGRTDWDDQGRLLGVGLTQRPTPHRYMVDGRTLYTWCAMDALIFPLILRRDARIESPCPATGTIVHVHVSEAAVTSVEPAAAVVSVLAPKGDWTLEHIRSDFCDNVSFYASAEAADGWRKLHPNGSVLPVADAYQLAGVMAAALINPTS